MGELGRSASGIQCSHDPALDGGGGRGGWSAARRSPWGDGLAVAVAWYELDLREPGWLRPAVEEAEALFEKMDLTGPFWALR